MVTTLPAPNSASTLPLTVEFDDENGQQIRVELLSDDSPPATAGVPLPGTTPRKVWKGRLFSLKNNAKGSLWGQNRTEGHTNWNDYEHKYPPDALGEEAFPDARVWRTMLDETNLFDLDKVEAWRDTLDVLLVFIGLFSAIVTTFVVQTSQSLQPDYAQVTALLVFQLVAMQSTNPTATPNPFPSLESLTSSFSPSPHDVRVNALWFTSLAISLSTGLLTVLTKQWLYHYMSLTSGSSRDRCRTRHFRYQGLLNWGVPTIIDLLPVALHISLALFLAGLVLFIFRLHHATAVVVGAIAGTGYMFYMLSVILPCIFPQCPWKSPLSWYLGTAITYISAFLSLWPSLIRHWYGRIDARYASLQPLPIFARLSERPVSLLEKEKAAIQRDRHQVDIDAMCWLYQMTSSTSVGSIVVQAVGGLSPSSADYTTIANIAHEYMRPDIRKYNDWATSGIPGRKETVERLLRTVLSTRHLQPGLHILLATDTTDDQGAKWTKLIRAVLFVHSAGHLPFLDALHSTLDLELPLPASVWDMALKCLGSIGTASTNYPAQMLRILDTILPHLPRTPPRIMTDDDIPVTSIGDALDHSSYLRQVVLDSLWSTFLPTKDNHGMSAPLAPLWNAVLKWTLSVASSNDWGDRPHRIINHILSSSVAVSDDVASDMQRFLACDASFDHSCTPWETIDHLASTLRPLDDHQIRLLLQHVKVVPNDYQEMGYTYLKDTLRKDLLRCLDGGLVLMRETDALLLLFGNPGDPYTRSSYMWLEKLVGNARKGRSGSSTAFLSEAATTYLHLQENLFGLCRGAILSERIRPAGTMRLFPVLLAEIQSDHPNWILCFRRLLDLFEDEPFLVELGATMDTPRHTLSYILWSLKSTLTLDATAADLEVPIYDTEGRRVATTEMAEVWWPKVADNPVKVVALENYVEPEAGRWRKILTGLSRWKMEMGPYDGETRHGRRQLGHDIELQ